MPRATRAENFPDAFVGKVTLSAYEPFPIISSTVYSQRRARLDPVHSLGAAGPVGLKNLVFQVSMNAVVPTATSAASTGSEAFSYGFTANIFKRQDYGANSTNLVTYATGSGASPPPELCRYWRWRRFADLRAVLEDRYDRRHVGPSAPPAGPATGSYLTGPKFLSVPFNQTYLSAGEYWLGIQHSSTTATSNSNVTLLSFSKLLQQWPVVTMGSLGGSATLAFSGPCGIGNRRGQRDHHQHHHGGERDQRVHSAARLLRDQQRMNPFRWCLIVGHDHIGPRELSRSRVLRSSRCLIGSAQRSDASSSGGSPPSASSRAGAGRSRTRSRLLLPAASTKMVPHEVRAPGRQDRG
jgi:hypothetical protein